MSIIPTGTSGLAALFAWPRWVWTAIGAYALFKAGGTIMAGAFAWLLHRDPSYLDRLPEPGWPWAVNVAVYLFGGIAMTVMAYRQAPIARETEQEVES